MQGSRFQSLLLCLVLFTGLSAQTTDPNSVTQNSKEARTKQVADRLQPLWDYNVHNVGKLWTTVNNDGILGNIYEYRDVLANRGAPSWYYPRYYSRKTYGKYTALWVGGVVGFDTLVTTATSIDAWGWWGANQEFTPPTDPSKMIQVTSSDINSPFYDEKAKAKQQFTAVFTDTFHNEWWMRFNDDVGRMHKPLGIEVTQTTYAWSAGYAEDFIIVDYEIKNISDKLIENGWIGLYHVGEIVWFSEHPLLKPKIDDNIGYKAFNPNISGTPCDSLMQMVWVCDNDGYPNGSIFDDGSTPNAFAIAPLRRPRFTRQNNFNWWVDNYYQPYNWGPRQATRVGYPFRSFGDGLGTPSGDRNKHYLMSHLEQDYSSFTTALDHSVDNWLPPPAFAEDIADGHAIQFLTSFGAFALNPGGVEHLTVVIMIGEDFLTEPLAYANLYDMYNPQPYMDYLNFDDLLTNYQWAKAIYDNPGVDSDMDGDSGMYYFEVDSISGDTIQIFCGGDGVPDFQGAEPPPSPKVRVSTEEGKIHLRWNGRDSEEDFDGFSRLYDFEGYRVYMARSAAEQDISVLASWDRIDFSRYQWNRHRQEYQNVTAPFTLDSLKVLYGNDFNPLDYPIHAPLYADGKAYYFEAVDYNYSTLGEATGIRKTYPDATLDTTDVDEEGRMKYYEYEFVIENLLPTIPYYVSVTAFDFGFPAKSLDPLESSPYNNQIEVYAMATDSNVQNQGVLNVYCYPNPYRLDDGYSDRGIENRFTAVAEDRARIINFANLPRQCTISIYSLDGDLVRTIEHDQPENSGTSAIERFDLITRNMQAVVAGLYYWVVESEEGNQIGKLAVIQ